MVGRFSTRELVAHGSEFDEAWTRWAEAVARRRLLAAGAGLAAIAGLALAATGMQLGSSDADTVARSGDAKQALVALEAAGIGEGALLPHEILVEGGADPERVAAAVGAVDGVHGAVAPASPDWRRGRTALVEAIPVPDSGVGAGKETLEAVRRAAHAAGPGVRVGGEPAGNADFIDAVYGSFPLMVALIAVTTFVPLARAFRSLLLPAKAILLNVLSVAAAWGALVLIWQEGYGSELIWGIPATGSIPSWLPLTACHRDPCTDRARGRPADGALELVTPRGPRPRAPCRAVAAGRADGGTLAASARR